MIAMGVSNAPQAYLADYWNRLDCFIVIAGGLEYILDIGNVNLTSIRTVRVLRPLRAINRIPSKYMGIFYVNNWSSSSTSSYCRD